MPLGPKRSQARAPAPAPEPLEELSLEYGGPAVDTSSPMVPRDLQVPLFYQVSFNDEAHARAAAEELDGSMLGGSTLRVIYNTRRENGKSINVQGIPRHVSEVAIRDHFSLVAEPTTVDRFDDDLYGEVRFKSADDAWNARVTLDGSQLYCKMLRVELDCSTDYMNKVLVHGINPAVMWQELKDHFKQAGEITFAAIHGGRTARIRFFRRDAAVTAMKRLNRSKLPGTTQTINVALPFDGTEDTAEVRVRRLPPGATVDDVRAHFAMCGEIDEVTIEAAESLPPEFCEDAQPPEIRN